MYVPSGIFNNLTPNTCLHYFRANYTQLANHVEVSTWLARFFYAALAKRKRCENVECDCWDSRWQVDHKLHVHASDKRQPIRIYFLLWAGHSVLRIIYVVGRCLNSSYLVFFVNAVAVKSGYCGDVLWLYFRKCLCVYGLLSQYRVDGP